jgi:hypothetical protein
MAYPALLVCTIHSVDIGIWLCFESFYVKTCSFLAHTVYWCFHFRYRINVLFCVDVCLAVCSPVVKLRNFLGAEYVQNFALQLHLIESPFLSLGSSKGGGTLVTVSTVFFLFLKILGCRREAYL